VNLRKDHYRGLFREERLPDLCHLLVGEVETGDGSREIGSWTRKRPRRQDISAEEVVVEPPAAGRISRSSFEKLNGLRNEKRKAKLSTTDLLALATMKNAAKRERKCELQISESLYL
jgi:hypothetical protein